MAVADTSFASYAQFQDEALRTGMDAVITASLAEAVPVMRVLMILYVLLGFMLLAGQRMTAHAFVGRVVRAVWVELERPDRRDRPAEERLLVCTDPDLPATEVITSYAKRWAVEPLFAAMKHGWGLKDAWQRSRQVLMRWVTILAAGYALSQMLAYADPARVPAGGSRRRGPNAYRHLRPSRRPAPWPSSPPTATCSSACSPSRTA